MFQRDCGTTTSFSTKISLIRLRDYLKILSENDCIIEGPPEDTSLSFTWSSSAESTIEKNLVAMDVELSQNWVFLTN